MPLEIRELHIRVNVNQPQSEEAKPAVSADDTKLNDDKEALIQQCIEQVMEIFNTKNER